MIDIGRTVQSATMGHRIQIPTTPGIHFFSKLIITIKLTMTSSGVYQTTRGHTTSRKDGKNHTSG